MTEKDLLLKMAVPIEANDCGTKSAVRHNRKTIYRPSLYLR